MICYPLLGFLILLLYQFAYRRAVEEWRAERLAEIYNQMLDEKETQSQICVDQTAGMRQ